MGIPHRVAIVAASPLVGEGLKAALAGDASLQVEAAVRRAEDVDESIGVPDVVVCAWADAHDAPSLQRLLSLHVPLVLLMPRHDALPPLHAAAEVAPLALLPVSAAPAQVRAAVQAVLAGLHVSSPELGAAGPWRAGFATDELPGEPLTPRELEVFELLAKGLSNPDIAAALGISVHTAKFHVGQILAKVGAATRAEAVMIGLRLGLIGV